MKLKMQRAYFWAECLVSFSLVLYHLIQCSWEISDAVSIYYLFALFFYYLELSPHPLSLLFQNHIQWEEQAEWVCGNQINFRLKTLLQTHYPGKLCSGFIQKLDQGLVYFWMNKLKKNRFKIPEFCFLSNTEHVSHRSRFCWASWHN